MSVARLRALQLVGFKSFAEKTLVEFGPGISAVVGPNGSGKSNLADALRWALGEQGRSLRTRKSEDVIFAGSAKRRATGMADVSLVIDNTDRLLPLDYAEVELGRRLFRSGENEYLLNRQRVRLKDLVELLDGANLADNAFLFIGQGMVDQALALRPEERRPLFEEVAGVRRHEKRRRQAESELIEAETNLERIRDIVAELRPQARRLAAQAEQQAARESAGRELATALVEAGRARWTAADVAAADAATRLQIARTDSDAALATLRRAEEELAALGHGLTEQAQVELQRRARLDDLRSASLEARVAQTRAQTELESLRRDKERLTEEREAAAARAEGARHDVAVAPSVDEDPDHGRQETDERAELEEAVATAVSALREARTEQAVESERAAAARRASEARNAELDRARRRVADLERRATEQAALAAGEARNAAGAEERRSATEALAATAAQVGAASEAALAEARLTHESAEDRRRQADGRTSALAGQLEAIRGRLAALDAMLESGDGDRLYATARRRGGRRLLEGVEVDRALGAAVEAALGDATRGIVIEEATVASLGDEQGVLVVADARRAASTAAPLAAAIRATEAARAAGGGPLAEATRRDPDGVVGRLLAGVLWVPGLAAALALRPVLPFGWRVATPDGQLVGEDGLVRLGAHDSLFERRSERDRLAGEASTIEAEETSARASAEALATTVVGAEQALADARRALDEVRRNRRLAEEDERGAVRAAESAQREAHWQAAQSERLVAELERARVALAAIDPRDGFWDAADASATGSSAAGRPAAGPLGQLEREVERLRARRDAIIAELAHRRAERDQAQERRRRAEVTAAMEESRLADLDARMRQVIDSETRAENESERLNADLVRSQAAEQVARSDLERALAESGAARARLESYERAAWDARHRLREAETQSRDVEVAEMEARLGLESTREALLVELAGIGSPGLEALRAEASGAATPDAASRDAALRAADPAPASGQPAEQIPEADVLADDLESALDAAITAWHAAPSGAEAPVPLPVTKLATLRRRYHELGATNPFAATEFHEVNERLTALEGQRADLERAIGATRQLIEDLAVLVATRFRDTFAALEGAFERQFQQLFDGGDAQLTLTTPEDLSVTGIEITARPPGKKRQALAMLSGGERALTAVALLFAMLEVRPVPFCVLDEVDAALDEANVGRFGAALRGLASDIQFVVITHNRATIEAADALYGVTVGDDAVSRVISLRISDVGAAEEPDRLIERDAPAAAAAS